VVCFNRRGKKKVVKTRKNDSKGVFSHKWGKKKIENESETQNDRGLNLFIFYSNNNNKINSSIKTFFYYLSSQRNNLLSHLLLVLFLLFISHLSRVTWLLELQHVYYEIFVELSIFLKLWGYSRAEGRWWLSQYK